MIDQPDVERLVSELAGSGVLDAEAITDLNVNYLEPWRNGALGAEELEFLTAYHARISGLPVGDAATAGDPLLLAPEEWQDQLDEMRARAERAEARILDLEADIAMLRAVPPA